MSPVPVVIRRSTIDVELLFFIFCFTFEVWSIVDFNQIKEAYSKLTIGPEYTSLLLFFLIISV